MFRLARLDGEDYCQGRVLNARARACVCVSSVGCRKPISRDDFCGVSERDILCEVS